jgi:hypothetical protein
MNSQAKQVKRINKKASTVPSLSKKKMLEFLNGDDDDIFDQMLNYQECHRIFDETDKALDKAHEELLEEMHEVRNGILSKKNKPSQYIFSSDESRDEFSMEFRDSQIEQLESDEEDEAYDKFYKQYRTSTPITKVQDDKDTEEVEQVSEDEEPEIIDISEDTMLPFIFSNTCSNPIVID